LDPLWKIDATLKAKGFSLSRPPSTYKGPISLHGNKAEVEIKIPDVTFVDMPELRLVDSSRVPVKNLAHLNRDGTICYVGEGGLPLDLYDPGGSILRILREAEITLERSFGGAATTEYEAELEAYWQGDFIHFAFPVAQSSKIENADIIDLGTSEDARYVLVPRGQWQRTNPRSRKSVTILCFGHKLKHTNSFKSENLAGVIDWLEAQQAAPSGLRQAIIGSTATLMPVFIISSNALLGWRPVLPNSLKMQQQAGGSRKKFFENQIAKSLDRIGLDRMTGIQSDLRSVVERNLFGSASLIGKRIALIGCGTIGGNLAKLFVQAGAGCGEDFTVYDRDVLRPGNLGRHVLGFADLDRPKAVATADFLRNFHPDVHIKPLQRDALQDWAALERTDMIVDATGDYNVANALNNMRMRSSKSGTELAVLHAWVFGNGLAAQTFLNLKDGQACYRCLKPKFDGAWRYPPTKDVKKSVELAPARCGEGGYVPFAADAPVAAASLALRATLDWAAKQPGQRLRTITLNHEDGKEVKWVSPSRSAECPACGA
jgi:molybdopterin/thiamine biosynthesis adenylyltransferase